MENESVHKMLYGETKELLLPSGIKVTIREQNGNDDDILSNVSNTKDLTNINLFVSSIVVDTDFTDNKKLSLEDTLNLLMKDKYYILFASRIHSIGKKISFKYDWGKDNGGSFPYTEDLSNYLWDYTMEFPYENNSKYFKERMQPYPKNAYGIHEKQLSSGKLLRHKCLDGNAEKYLLSLPIEQLTKNVELKARNLELKNKEGTWEKVDNFKFFSKKEMMELHKYINEIDTSFSGNTEITNPVNGQIIDYVIMQSMDFFYPQEI